MPNKTSLLSFLSELFTCLLKWFLL